MFPILIGIGISLVLSSCVDDDESGSLTPDEPLPLPKDESDDSVADIWQMTDLVAESDTQPDSSSQPACEPESCSSGVMFRQNSQEGLCVDFIKKSGKELGLNNAFPHRGFTFVDYDGDGKEDIYLLNHEAPDQLFKNHGAGFADISNQSGVKFGGFSRKAAFGDYDGDGDKDLLLVGDEGTHLYENDDGFFYLLDAAMGIHNAEPGKTALWLGSDALVGTQNGTYYYRYLGGNKFEEISQTLGIKDYGDSTAFVTDDFNGDGSKDVYIANMTGPNRLFFGSTDGSFVSADSMMPHGEHGNATDARAIRLPGYNGPSLYVTNYGSRNYLYVNHQDGTFSEVAQDFSLQDPGQTMGSTWASIAGAQWPFVFLSRWNEPNLLYVPEYPAGPDDGLHYTERAYTFQMDTTGQTLGAEWVDLNQDEHLDLMTIQATGAIEIFENQSHIVNICSHEQKGTR